MDINEVAKRVTRLERAFRALAQNVPGLSIDIVGTMSSDRSLVHPVAGFQVKLQHDHDGSRVHLYISANYAELTRWPGADDAQSGARRERFNVRLAEDYEWGDSSFEDPAELAHELLSYMQFNLDVLSTT